MANPCPVCSQHGRLTYEVHKINQAARGELAAQVGQLEALIQTAAILLEGGQPGPEVAAMLRQHLGQPAMVTHVTYHHITFDRAAGDRVGGWPA